MAVTISELQNPFYGLTVNRFQGAHFIMDPRIIIVAGLLGSGTFAGGYFLMRPGPAPVAEVSTPTEVPTIEPLEVAPPPRAVPASLPPLRSPQKPAETKAPWEAPVSPVLATWKIPSFVDENGKADEMATWPKEIGVAATGKSVAVASSRRVVVFVPGKPAPEATIRYSLMAQAFIPPTGQGIFVTADKPARMLVYDYAGKSVGTFEPKTAKPQWLGSFTSPGYYADGSLLIGFSQAEDRGFYRIHPRTGQGSRVTDNLPEDLLSRGQALHPLPDQRLLAILSTPPTKGQDFSLSIVDRTGAVQRITGVPSPALAKSTIHRRIAFSPDGRHVSVFGNNQLEIWDWKQGKRTINYERQYYYPSQCCFTPDGKRLLVLSGSEYVKQTMNGLGIIKGIDPLPVMIELFDAASGKRLAEFTPRRHDLGNPFHLAVSADGRRVAITSREQVGLLDFARMFGLDPIAVGNGL